MDDNDNFVSLVALHSAEGMLGPTPVLFASNIATIETIAPKDVGMDPYRLLDERSSKVSVLGRASWVGIGPVRWFFARLKARSDGKPNTVGMVPTKLF